MADYPVLSAEEVQQRINGVRGVHLHRHLELEIVEVKPGESLACYTVKEQHANNLGVVHGGVHYALLDTAAYLATLPLLSPGTNCVTAEISVSVLKPVPQGSRVEMRGKVRRRGKTMIFVDSEAFVDGKLVAMARLIKAVVPLPGQAK